MSKELSDLERRAENYRAALEKIAELARARCDQDVFLEIASDALAEDMQSPAKGDAQLATDLYFAEL
jgi:hypothetical protein